MVVGSMSKELILALNSFCNAASVADLIKAARQYGTPEPLQSLWGDSGENAGYLTDILMRRQ